MGFLNVSRQLCSPVPLGGHRAALLAWRWSESLTQPWQPGGTQRWWLWRADGASSAARRTAGLI